MSKTFKVAMEKQYANDDEETLTVYGIMEIEAKSQEDAHLKVQGMLTLENRILQTTDPRIKWDTDFQELDDDGFGYVDFSFQISDVDPEDIEV